MQNSHYLVYKQLLLLQAVGTKLSLRYLRRFLDEPIMVNARSFTTSNKTKTKMKMVLGNNNAQLTSGWNEIVIKYNIREGDIILFSFNPKSYGRLNLVIMGLPRLETTPMMMPV
jgi:hypothetical protein